MIAAAIVLGLAAGSACAKEAPPAYAQSARWHVGGDGGWDYLAFAESGGRLFVTHGDRVVVLDAADGRRLGEVAPTAGVHGVAFAPALGKGFASAGKADAVVVFDLRTLAVTANVAVGRNPDALLFDAPTARVFAFNGRSHDASVIDANGGKVLATIPLGGKPEFAVSDGKGRVYVNIEDRTELAVIDAAAAKVVATWPLAGCEEPSGLAIDVEHARLFSVCANARLAVTDARSGKHVADVSIGKGPDAVAFDAQRRLLFSSNGEDGTLTVVRESTPDRYDVVQNLSTQRSARTLALDPRTHRLFLAAAEVMPQPAGAEAHRQPPLKPDSFGVIVVAAPGTP
jgi:YVTN family beta-propeller protein